MHFSSGYFNFSDVCSLRYVIFDFECIFILSLQFKSVSIDVILSTNVDLKLERSVKNIKSQNQNGGCSASKGPTASGNADPQPVDCSRCVVSVKHKYLVL